MAAFRCFPLLASVVISLSSLEAFAAVRVKRGQDLLSIPWTRATPQSGPFMNLVQGDGRTNVPAFAPDASPSVSCLWLLKYHAARPGDPAHFTSFCGDKLAASDVMPLLTSGEVAAIRDGKSIVPNTAQQNKLLAVLVRRRIAENSASTGQISSHGGRNQRRILRRRRQATGKNAWLNYVIHNQNSGGQTGRQCQPQDCLGVLKYHRPTPQYPQGSFTDFCQSFVPAQFVLSKGQIPGRGSKYPGPGSLITAKELALLAQDKGIFLDACRQTALAAVLARAGRPPAGDLFGSGAGGGVGNGGLFGKRRKRKASILDSSQNQRRANHPRTRRQIRRFCSRQHCLGWLEYVPKNDSLGTPAFMKDFCQRAIPVGLVVSGQQEITNTTVSGPGSLLATGHLRILAQKKPVLVDTCRQTALALVLAQNGYPPPPNQIGVPFAFPGVGKRRRKRQLPLGGGARSTNPFLPQALPITGPVISRSTPACGPFANVVHNSRSPFRCIRPGQQTTQQGNCLASLQFVAPTQAEPQGYYVDACGRKIAREIVEGSRTSVQPTVSTTTADLGLDNRNLRFTNPSDENLSTTLAPTTEEPTTTTTETTTEELTTATEPPATAIKTGSGTGISQDELKALLKKGKAASITRQELARRRGEVKSR
jgi:hypothetical protein